MQEPNENGVYEAEITYELARKGRSYAAVTVARCRDGLYRHAIQFQYSYGGRGGPITDHSTGYPTAEAARDAGAEQLLGEFPKDRSDHPPSVDRELAHLREQLDARYRQPTLF